MYIVFPVFGLNLAGEMLKSKQKKNDMELEAYGSQTGSSSYLSLTTFSDNIKHSEMSHLNLGTLSLSNSLLNLSISLAGWPLISKCVQTSVCVKKLKN